MVGKLVTPQLVASLEVSAPIVKDDDLYDFKLGPALASSSESGGTGARGLHAAERHPGQPRHTMDWLGSRCSAYPVVKW
jgi:hypothetical protein